MDTEGCEELDLPCRVQNATMNGLILPSATPCSCCETCLTNLKRGEFCSIGEPGSPFPKSICGDHLYCKIKKGDQYPTCQPMLESSKCYLEKYKFASDIRSGAVGHLLDSPTCNGDGKFHPRVCIPGQNCYCTNERGERIFGEGLPHQEQHCECSRMNDNMKNLLDKNVPFFSMRCTADGSFDRLQCFGNLCICVDEKTGSQTSDVMKIYDLPCFDKSIHPRNASELIKPCEIIKQSLINTIYEAESEGMFMDDILVDICDPDGSFSAVQENDLSKFCADKNGNKIEEFSVRKGTKDADKMNCKCARARQLLMSSGQLEIPNCCTNGNYKKLACRRGYCYCVDGDGRQSSVEVIDMMKSKLSCKENDCN